MAITDKPSVSKVIAVLQAADGLMEKYGRRVSAGTPGLMAEWAIEIVCCAPPNLSEVAEGASKALVDSSRTDLLQRMRDAGGNQARDLMLTIVATIEVLIGERMWDAIEHNEAGILKKCIKAFHQLSDKSS